MGRINMRTIHMLINCSRCKIHQDFFTSQANIYYIHFIQKVLLLKSMTLMNYAVIENGKNAPRQDIIFTSVITITR